MKLCPVCREPEPPGRGCKRHWAPLPHRLKCFVWKADAVEATRLRVMVFLPDLVLDYYASHPA